MTQNPRIQAIISTFVAELSEALTEESTSAIRAALGGSLTKNGGARRRGAGRPKGSSTSAPGRVRKKGGKRSPEELEQLTKTLLAAIKKAPGSRIEQIGKTVGVPTKELALPIRKLLADKAIGKKGQKRATTYSAR
jgi:hypothetical protein